MGFLDGLFRPPKVEPAPGGEPVDTELFGKFVFAYVHDHLFLGREGEPWVSELNRASRMSLDDLQISFRTEYLNLLLGASRSAVLDHRGEDAADLVAASAADSAIGALKDQIGSRAAAGVDWDQARELMRDQTAYYASLHDEVDGVQKIAAVAFQRLVPGEASDSRAEACLAKQYDRVVSLTEEFLGRNPLVVDG